MKYRTKLFLTFSSLVFISTTIAMLAMYGESSRLLFTQIREELLSVAVSSAATISGNTIENLTSKESTNTDSYKKLLEQLRFLRDSNRLPSLYVKYMYIIKPVPGKDHYIFVADAEENPQDASKYGDLFPSLEELYQNQNNAFTEQHIKSDLWGKWLTSYAPIYNSEGQYVATLGVDISVIDIRHKMYMLIFYGMIALVGSLIISIIIAHLLAKLVTNSLNELCQTVYEIGSGNLKARAHLDSEDEFDNLASEINSMAHGLEEREKLKLGFTRYVSKYVLDKILKSESSTKLEGERKKVTVFFSDIRSFTKISENLPPETVVSLLNQYFEKMITVIFEHQGMLDKFIGDGIMVEFGAPLDDSMQELHAVKAAAHMQKEIAALSFKWKQEGYPELEVGMGIHTGFAILGNIGSDVRMEYTAIGDTVNVASRLEQMTKKLNKKIIISEDTYKAVKDEPGFVFEDLGKIELAGREQFIHAYAITAKD